MLKNSDKNLNKNFKFNCCIFAQIAINNNLKFKLLYVIYLC